MNSIPLVVLAFAAALSIPILVVIQTLRKAARSRKLKCPVRLRPARVLFSVAPNGRRLDVMRCSIFGRRTPSCGKVCIYTTPA